MEENKPRWEKKYERYVSEEPIANKIKQKEEEIETLQNELEELKTSEIVDVHTSEEYRKAETEKKDKIIKKEKEINDKKNSKELEGYRNYEKNKDKIKNILEYRNGLKNELKKIMDNRNEIKEAKKKLPELESEMDKLFEYVNNNPKAPDIEDKKRELYDIVEQRRVLLDKHKNLDIDENKLNEEKVIVYERKIAKCNIIAAGLMKGKELGDIELKVEPRKFTGDKEVREKLSKAEESRKMPKEAHESPEVEPTVAKPEEKLEEDPEEIKNEETELEPVSDFDKRHPILAKIKKMFKKISNILQGKDGKEEEELEKELEEEPEVILDDIEETEPTNDFDTRNPRLAKIRDILQGKNKEEEIDEKDEVLKIDDSEEEVVKIDDSKEIVLKIDDPEEEVVKIDDSKEIVLKIDDPEEEVVLKIDDSEEEINIDEKDENDELKRIAEIGKKNALREKYEINHQKAADDLARKYGGKYERQDGTQATQEDEKEL